MSLNSSRSLTEWCRDAAALFGGVVGTLTIVWMVAPQALLPSASATLMPESCLNQSPGDRGQFTVIESEGGASSRAARADVWVPSAQPDCQRISTLGVFSPSFNGFYEFGWVLGWSTVDGDAHTVPTMFHVGTNNGGGTQAAQVFDNRNPSRDAFHSIQASDLNRNSFWNGSVDGRGDFTAANLDYTGGTVYVNVERGHAQDRCFHEFQSIEENFNDWNFTDDLRRNGTDPDCVLHIDPNEHHIEVLNN